MSTSALQGTRESLEQTTVAAEQIVSGNISAQNMIALREGSFLYSINLKLIKIADEMIGQSLNLLA